jgi:hypothetical protein
VPVLSIVGDHDHRQRAQRLDVLALHEMRADLERRKASTAARSSALEVLETALASSASALSLTLGKRRGIHGAGPFRNR